MEFQRARLDERPDMGLIDHFEAQIVPLLRERRRFAGSADFRLYDVVAENGELLEDVFAYSNGRGPDRSLIVYHNAFGSATGWIRDSIPFAVKAADGSKTSRRDNLADALGLSGESEGWLRFRDARSGLESLRSVEEVRRRGLHVQLEAYSRLVLLEISEVSQTAGEPWAALAAELAGGWLPSLDEALADLRLRPVHDAVARLLDPAADIAARWAEVAAAAGIVDEGPPSLTPTPSVDRAGRAAALLSPLGRTRFDALRLGGALRRLGLDDREIARARIAIGLPHPAEVADPAVLAERWLADPDVRAFLAVHEWEGAEWLDRDRWLELLELAAELDRAAGRTRRSPAIAVLRSEAEAAGYRTDALMAGLRSRPGATSSRAARPGPGGPGTAGTAARKTTGPRRP
jgi:hypothetical protein